MKWAPTARKFLVALSALVAEAITLGLLSGDAQKWATGAIALAGTFLVYLIPNEHPTVPVPVPAPEPVVAEAEPPPL
jgi:hypothetical protein